jgi:hypothetical protein
VWRYQTRCCHIIHLKERKKLWRKPLFHLFDLVVVNAQMLHNKPSKKNTLLETFYEKLPASDGTEMQVQGPAGRLVG